jgi:hypothetical protein
MEVDPLLSSLYHEIQQNNTQKVFEILGSDHEALEENQLVNAECPWTALHWATFHGNEAVRDIKIYILNYNHSELTLMMKYRYN